MSRRSALDVMLPLVVVAGAWAVHRTDAYRVLVGEDAVYEWLQVAAMGAAVVWLVATRRLLHIAIAVLLFIAIGEELAWGTRLFDHGLSGIEARNAQGETTLHNIGAGLELSFAAIAVASALAGLWIVATMRAGRVLAVWFLVPAVYAVVRLVVDVSYDVAKLSEAAELCFAVGVARLAWLERRSVKV